MEWKVSKSSRTYLFLRVQHNSQVTLDFPNPHSSSIPGESFQSLGAPRSMVSESFHIVQTFALRDPQTKQRTHPVRTQQDSENRNSPRGSPHCVPKKPKGGTETAQIKINPATQHRQKSRNFFVKQAQLTLKRYLALLRATKQTSHLCGETCWIPPELKAVISHLAWRFLMLPSPNPWCIPDNFLANCRVLSAPILHSIDHHRKTKKPLSRFQSRATSFARLTLPIRLSSEIQQLPDAGAALQLCYAEKSLPSLTATRAFWDFSMCVRNGERKVRFLLSLGTLEKYSILLQ